jgi:hypothetical protein
MAFNNISHYKAYRTKLLRELYPNESPVSIGKVIFKTSSLKGVTVRLWKDEISIVLEEEYTLKNIELLNNLADATKHLNVFFKMKIGKTYIVLNPINKNEFPDTITGMENRARYYVLCLDLFLKFLIK